MDWLNYNHLLYFWTVAKEGSVTAACQQLHVAQPTVSGQLRRLERALGHKLFQRRGRGLALTEMGQTAFRYADDIFAIGAELTDTLRGRTPRNRLRVRIGVADVLPKLVVHRMLLPLRELPEPVYVTCYEGKLGDLLGRLAVHDLDVVLGDTPVSAYTGLAAYSHRLGESDLVVFGVAALAKRYRPGFPQSLDGAPLLLPTSYTAVRRALDAWFERLDIRPLVRWEFEDSALLQVFGQSGAGLFVAPRIIEREIRAQYGVQVVGRVPAVREQFYAISMERRIQHPAIAALTDAARERLLGAHADVASKRRPPRSAARRSAQGSTE